MDDIVELLEEAIRTLKSGYNSYICVAFRVAYCDKYDAYDNDFGVRIPTVTIYDMYRKYPKLKKFIFEHGNYLRKQAGNSSAFSNNCTWFLRGITGDRTEYRVNKIEEFIKELESV